MTSVKVATKVTVVTVVAVVTVVKLETLVTVDTDLEKIHFFTNSKLFGIQICWKKRVNDDKFEIPTKQR